MRAPVPADAPEGSAPGGPSSEGGSSDVAVAVRNGLRLAMSLLATWTVALAVRFQLPRHLGPEAFGHYNFCDAFTGSFFSLLSLGVGTYIMKEIAVRPQHASDFFGGLLAVRGVLGALALLVIAFVLGLSDYPPGLKPLVIAFGLVHFVIGVNSYLACILQASTQVKALANVNVIAKLVWGGGIALALWFDAPLFVLVLPSLLAELLKLMVLVPAARRAVGLTFRIDLTATKGVVIASFPFYANSVAVDLGTRVDVSMLEFLAHTKEVGWYSAANNFAALAMMVSPVVGWVVMPMLSRARARSDEEFFALLQQSIRGVLVLAIPGSLLIALGADVFVSIAFGSAFEPAVQAVQVLAIMFLATYLAILLSVSLIVLQRSWTLTLVSLVSLGVEAVLIVAAVLLLRDAGDGSAATGAAIGLAGSEVITVLLLLRAVGPRAFDRSSMGSIAKCLALCLATWALHLSLSSLGPWRLAIDALAYAIGLFATGAVKPSEIRALIQLVREQRRGAPA